MHCRVYRQLLSVLSPPAAHHDDYFVLEGWPGHGVSVAGLAGETSLFENGFRTGLECRKLARAQIRLKVREQARA